MDEKKLFKEIIEAKIFDKDQIFNNIIEKIEEDELESDLNVLLLLILNRKESYGVEICKELTILTDGKLKDRESCIYPILHKLENEDLLKSYWKDNRKYYAIGLKGKRYLKEKKSIIEKLNKANKVALKEEFSWS